MSLTIPVILVEEMKKIIYVENIFMSPISLPDGKNKRKNNTNYSLRENNYVSHRIFKYNKRRGKLNKRKNVLGNSSYISCLSTREF